MADRPKNPIIPGSTKDRTGTGGILRRAVAEIARRFAGLEVDVLALFDAIPVYALNDLRTLPVVYGMTPQQMERLSTELAAALERWIANGRDPAHMLWYAPFDEQAMQLGTAQSAANLANLSPVYAAARSLETVIYSEPYRNRLAMAQLRSYEHWTGLAGTTRADLAQLIGRAVVDGQSPIVARKAIVEKLGVSKARAMLYAQTDITGTLREARWAESETAREKLGVQTGMLWTSALKPTTRPWHASRHGKVFSTMAVREFYGSNGNRFNCYCGQTECLIDADGAPILTDGLKSKVRAERDAWQKDVLAV